jgi:hypothetical protein
MPILGILVGGLDVLCLIHAARARQPYYWFMIIVSLPLAGSIAYFLMEVLPDMRHSRAGREVAQDIGAVIDPDKQIREATAHLAKSDTAENRKTLAEALIAKERFGEAQQLYETALTGAHVDDPALMMGLARARFGLKDYAGVCKTLDDLRVAHPDFESAEGHMLYARSREGAGELDQALTEYGSLAGYFSGEEARCRYALLLQKMGRVDEARAFFGQIVRSVDSGGKGYFRAQREWYEVARRNLER